MKPFLGYNAADSADEELLYGEEFVVDKINETGAALLDRAAEDVEELENRAELPLPLKIAMYGSLIIGVAISGGIISAATESEDGLTLGQMFSDMPFLFFIAGALLVLSAVLMLIARKSHKHLIESDEHIRAVAKMDAAVRNVLADFGVPADAMDVDVLSFEFKAVDGEVKIKKGQYIGNLSYKAYADGENLYLADPAEKYAFPLRELRSIATVNKSLSIVEWNKETPHNKGEYKQYKISEDKYGTIHFKPYHILKLEHNGVEWGIYFPCYELPVFERLTGLKSE